MTSYRVQPASAPLSGTAFLPSDKSISHRALILAALANGVSHIDGRSFGGDIGSSVGALRALGVVISDEHESIVVHGKGLWGLRVPDGDLDCGNSGTTMRLLAGVLAAQPFPFRLVGDASLSKRPMRRVLAPLVARGARLEGTQVGMDVCAPLIGFARNDGKFLEPLHFDLETSSAQVKSALLLSGLFSEGVTDLSEPSPSRDHTERLLQALGVPLTTGSRIRLDPSSWTRAWPGFALSVPGDLSAAAFLLGAVMTVPGSSITLEGVGVNDTRTGILDWLLETGVTLDREDEVERGREPTATLSLVHERGKAARLAGPLLVRAIDEVPAICAIAASLEGVTLIADAAELRVKESDRIRACASVLRTFGLQVEEYDAGLAVEGKPDAPLNACEVDSQGDHRIAMMAAVLALRASAPCLVRNTACVRTSFPDFVATLRSIGAPIEEVA